MLDNDDKPRTRVSERTHVDEPLGCLSLARPASASLPMFRLSVESCCLTHLFHHIYFQRGVGKAAVGLSLSLIAPSEDKSHARLVASLEAKFEDVIMDSRLLNASEERVNLASKVVMTSDQEQKTNRANQWFKDSAAQAGLEIDDNCLDEGLAGGDLRDRSRLREAQKARVRLRELLQQPMQTQRYGKFLSTNTAARRNGVVPAAAVVRLPSAGQSVKGPRKNRRIR